MITQTASPPIKPPTRPGCFMGTYEPKDEAKYWNVPQSAWLTAEGAKTVRFLGFEDFDFFVHALGGRWRVTEATSGHMACPESYPTREDAVKWTEQNLFTHGVEGLIAAITKAAEIIGARQRP